MMWEVILKDRITKEEVVVADLSTRRNLACFVEFCKSITPVSF